MNGVLNTTPQREQGIFGIRGEPLLTLRVSRPRHDQRWCAVTRSRSAASPAKRTCGPRSVNAEGVEHASPGSQACLRTLGIVASNKMYPEGVLQPDSYRIGRSLLQAALQPACHPLRGRLCKTTSWCHVPRPAFPGCARCAHDPGLGCATASRLKTVAHCCRIREKTLLTLRVGICRTHARGEHHR
jgi:hypothetical protein